MNMIPLWSLPPRASHEGQLSAEVPHSADPQMKETAPCDVATSNPVASSPADNLEDAVPVQDQYPVEYDPFDRPVEEVVMQLFDDDPPANPPPTKRRRAGDQ